MKRSAEMPASAGNAAGEATARQGGIWQPVNLARPVPLVMPANPDTMSAASVTLLPAQRRAAWADVERILAIRLDNLGDVLMTTPALQAIRSARPRSRIDLLAAPGLLVAAQHLPGINHMIPFAAPWMKASAASDGGATLAMVGQLRALHYDAAVIFTSFSQSPLPAALLCQMAGIGLRIAHCHENPYQLLSDWLPDTEPTQQIRHEVQRQLDLVGALGWHGTDRRLALTVTADDLAAVRQQLGALGIDCARPFIVLHPGATAASRRYPPPAWRAVLTALSQSCSHPLILTGSQAETDLVDGIACGLQAPVHCLAGTLSLGRFAALLQLASVLVSNNSGPVHIACAVGTPVVDLYALTNPQHTPWGVPNRVLYHPVPCGFCYRSICNAGHHACLRDIDPMQVRDAALALLDAALAG